VWVQLFAVPGLKGFWFRHVFWVGTVEDIKSRNTRRTNSTVRLSKSYRFFYWFLYWFGCLWYGVNPVSGTG
jgi:hypothetical protein